MFVTHEDKKEKEKEKRRKNSDTIFSNKNEIKQINELKDK